MQSRFAGEGARLVLVLSSQICRRSVPVPCRQRRARQQSRTGEIDALGELVTWATSVDEFALVLVGAVESTTPVLHNVRMEALVAAVLAPPRVLTPEWIAFYNGSVEALGASSRARRCQIRWSGGGHSGDRRGLRCCRGRPRRRGGGRRQSSRGGRRQSRGHCVRWQGAVVVSVRRCRCAGCACRCGCAVLGRCHACHPRVDRQAACPAVCAGAHARGEEADGDNK